MYLKEGRSYKDREGSIWICEQASVYDGGCLWCRDERGDRWLFTGDGRYTYFDNDHPYDLVEELP